MTRIKLKHVDRFTDRHGSARYYFRRGKGARIALPGQPGSTEFMEAYQAALAGAELPKVAKQRGEAGTIDRLVSDYFQSPDFLRMKPQTQRTYRQKIERWVRVEKIGHRPVRGMTREHINSMMGKRVKTPGAANDMLKKIRILMNFAITAGIRTDNPTAKIKKYKEGEFHTWTDAEINTFEAWWPEGTKERLAFALLLYTGQRLSDAVQMTRADLDEGVIQVAQQKTGARLWIPLHPELQRIISISELNHMVILTTTYGKPFTAAGFGNWMAERIGAADLPDRCVTHGIRKAAARRLADAGCSAHEIMAITGHKTLEMVEHYTKAADQKRLAKAAVARLPERRENGGSQT